MGDGLAMGWRAVWAGKVCFCSCQIRASGRDYVRQGPSIAVRLAIHGGRGMELAGGLFRGYRGAEDTGFGVVFDDLDGVALEGAHLDHLVDVLLEQTEVDEACVEAGDEEFSCAVLVDAGGDAGGEGFVPEVDEVFAACGVFRLAALACGGEDLFGLHVEEAEAHGAVAHDALDMSASAAAAEFFLIVERDGGVTALEDSFGEGVAAVADAYAEGPDADEVVELAGGCGEACGDRVGVIEDVDVGVEAGGFELGAEEFGDACALELGDVGGVFYDAVLDDAGEGDAYCGDVGGGWAVADDGHDLFADGADEGLGVELDECGFVVIFYIGERADGPVDPVVVDESDAYAVRENNADGLRHVIFACLGQ